MGDPLFLNNLALINKSFLKYEINTIQLAKTTIKDNLILQHTIFNHWYLYLTLRPPKNNTKNFSKMIIIDFNFKTFYIDLIEQQT